MPDLTLSFALIPIPRGGHSLAYFGLTVDTLCLDSNSEGRTLDRSIHHHHATALP